MPRSSVEFDYFVPFQVQAQLESEWCWAAVSTSIAHYYNPSSSVTQCQVVNQQLGPNGLL